MTAYVVIGGGIVGLATAYRLVTDRPDAEVTVVEKEHTWGAHQTGHNSGVIHAGVYYRPGSLKARLCKAGSASMVEFCTEHGIPARVCGKLIVATGPDELPRLRALHERARANELPERLHLVRGLIYPVPDPQFPFLGVHLTRMIDGSVHAGPNAVLALAREGYRWARIRPRDVFDVATYPGLWRLGRRHYRYGWTEV